MSTSTSQSGVPGAGPAPVKFRKRWFFQRALGVCATHEPADPGCWEVANGRVLIDLARAPELAAPGGALRLEGRSLPNRVLIVRGERGEFRAYVNGCTHGGRRLDPVPGEDTIQCCSVGKSTFDSEGNVIFGPAKQALTRLAVEPEESRLVVSLSR